MSLLSDSVGVIGGIGLVGLVFFGSLATISARNDDIAQTKAQELTEEFVYAAANIGEITESNLTEYYDGLDTLQKGIEPSLEVKILDDNVGKKSTWTTDSVVGENGYYSVFGGTIEEQVYNTGSYAMNEGDILTASYTGSEGAVMGALNTLLGKGSAFSGSATAMATTNGSN